MELGREEKFGGMRAWAVRLERGTKPCFVGVDRSND